MGLFAMLASVGGGIGAGGGSSPGSTYEDPVSGNISFTDAQFNYSVPAYGGTGYWGRSPQGYVEFRTNETAMDIKIGGNWSGAAGAQSQIDIWVDGVYNQSVTLTANNTTQNKPITLPGGSKIVWLLNGYTANESGFDIVTPGNGVFVQGVITTGDIEIKIPVEEQKMLLVVDSNGVGALASHPASTSWPALIRAGGQPVQVDGFGGRRLLTYDAGLVDEMVNSLSAQLNSGDVLVMDIGTNNWGLSSGHTKAQFKQWYADFLVDFHAARPDVMVVCVSPTNRTGYDTANGVGATLEDYADAMEENQAIYTWSHFIYGKDLVSIGNMPDGLHYNDTGHAQKASNFMTAFNAL